MMNTSSNGRDSIDVNKTILKACAEGNCATVKEMLEKLTTPLIHVVDDMKCNTLHHAVSKNYTLLTSLLLPHITDVNSPNRLGSTPLHYAAANGATQCIKILLNHPLIMKNQKDEYGYAPIHLAVKKNCLETVSELIEGNVDVNVRRPGCGSTPLHFAVEIGSRSMVELLLSKGASLSARDDRKRTPLMKAAEMTSERKEEKASWLNLYAQLICGDESLFKTKGTNGRNVLHQAAMCGNVQFIRVLALLIPYAKYSALLLEKDSEESSTPLHLAVKYGHSQSIATLLLMEPKAVHITDKNMNTPLHVVCLKLSSIMTVEGKKKRESQDEDEFQADQAKFFSVAVQIVRAGGELNKVNSAKTSCQKLLEAAKLDKRLQLSIRI